MTIGVRPTPYGSTRSVGPRREAWYELPMRRGLCAIVAMLSICASAQAQEDPRWQQAVQLRQQGQDEQALDVFQQIHRDTGSSRSLAQIALAEQALGRWNDAASHLDQALAQPDDWVQRNRATLEQARAEIAQHATTAPSAPAASGGGGELTVVGGLLLGVAAASLIVTAIGAGLYEMHAREWNSAACFPNVGRTREQMCGEDYRSAHRAAYTATGFGVGGAVLAAVGIALLAVGSGNESSAGVACAPGGELGVVCRGRF
jgi:hypothetical protein